MKKLSEILKLAMPSYIEHINDTDTQSFNYRDRKAPLGNMCSRLRGLSYDETINFEEWKKTKEAISKKIEGEAYLYKYLTSKGRKTTAAAQIQFYQKWIKQLEREGL